MKKKCTVCNGKELQMNVMYYLLDISTNMWIKDKGVGLTTDLNKALLYKYDRLPDCSTGLFKAVITTKVQPGMGTGKTLKTVYVLQTVKNGRNFYYIEPGKLVGNLTKAKQFKNPEYAEFTRQDFFPDNDNWVVLPYKVEVNKPINTDNEDVND